MQSESTNVHNPSPIVDTLLYVTKKTQDVTINMKGVAEIALEVLHYFIHNYKNENIKQVACGRYVRLSSELHPKPHDDRAADWLFVINTLNFALWSKMHEEQWRVNGLTGYMALCAAIKRAIDDEKPIWNPQFYTNLSMTDMKHIFRGDDDHVIPRIFQRLVLLHNIGKILLEKYEGTFKKCITLCKGDSQKLMEIIITFPSYNDLTRYDAESVHLFTKGWILIADIWSFFKSNRKLAIKLTEKSPTIFVDYRVSQIFNHFNALIFSKDFLDKLEKQNVFMHGSKEELEIRCCSLQIVKYVYKIVKEKSEDYIQLKIPELKPTDLDCMSLIDNFLWDYRQEYDLQLKKRVFCKVTTEQY